MSEKKNGVLVKKEVVIEVLKQRMGVREIVLGGGKGVRSNYMRIVQ